MRKIKRIIQKILFYLLQKLNMVEYTLTQVDAVTRLMQVAITGNGEVVNVGYDDKNSYSEKGIIFLCYSLHFNDCAFGVEIRYIKISGKIELYSTGNTHISYKRLITINSALTNFYVNFNERKDTILDVLENLPLNR